MPTLTLQTSYKKNTGLVISVDELLSTYFYGLPIQSNDGTQLDRQTVKLNIQAAQAEIEKYFDLVLFPCLISENLDYYRDDYENGFPFIRTSYPVRSTRALLGRLNGIDQIRYPGEWLQARGSSKGRFYRQFAVIPNGSSVNADANVILLGISAYYGIRSYPQIPNYWYTQYESGYLPGTAPAELVNLVGMLASIPLLAIAGDLVLSSPGLANISLGIDGLSQSVSSKGNAFGERIKTYITQIDTTSKRLRSSYRGKTFIVC